MTEKLKKRNNLRLKTKIGNKEFWKLVNKVQKQLSHIHTVEDEHENIHTDIQMIENIVLEELAKIVKGQR